MKGRGGPEVTGQEVGAGRRRQESEKRKIDLIGYNTPEVPPTS